MRIVKYVGEPKNIGRFGEVAKGQNLSLTEGEWDCVCDDKAFQLVGGDVNEEAMELGSGILPIGTPVFDLRTIPWENPNIFNRLTARASRNQLRSIIEAMRLAGAVVTEPDYDGDKLFVVDAVISAAKNMRWNLFNETQRMKMPRLEDDGAGKLVLREENDTPTPTLPRIHGDAPAPRFTKGGEELVTVVVEQQGEELKPAEKKSSKKLKTLPAFRKRGKRQPAMT